MVLYGIQKRVPVLVKHLHQYLFEPLFTFTRLPSSYLLYSYWFHVLCYGGRKITCGRLVLRALICKHEYERKLLPPLCGAFLPTSHMGLLPKLFGAIHFTPVIADVYTSPWKLFSILMVLRKWMSPLNTSTQILRNGLATSHGPLLPTHSDEIYFTVHTYTS